MENVNGASVKIFSFNELNVAVIWEPEEEDTEMGREKIWRNNNIK
jgi:hypothetical protein